MKAEFGPPGVTYIELDCDESPSPTLAVRLEEAAIYKYLRSSGESVCVYGAIHRYAS